MRLRRPLAILGASLAWGCDPVPDLYVVHASVDAGSGLADAIAVVDAGDGGEDAAEGAAGDAGPEGCSGVSCPGCAPNPGECCSSGIPCVGVNCATDCDGGCSACGSGEMCCSKQVGQQICRGVDAGKCPP